MSRVRCCNSILCVLLVGALCAVGCSGSDSLEGESNQKGGNASGKKQASEENEKSDGSGGSKSNSGKGGGTSKGGTTNQGGSDGEAGSDGEGGSKKESPSETGGRAIRGGETGGGAGASGKAGSSGTAGSRRGSGGSTGKGGDSTGGRNTVDGTGGQSGTGGMAGGSAGSAGGGDVSGLDKFSFFVTSLRALQTLSKSEKGFGGDLRFGQSDGLAGADEICRQIAEDSMPGSGAKQWRAFLSVTKGPNGSPINAIDRVGEGPWYDRLGRVFAKTKADLAKVRPNGADTAIRNDLPNEEGVPNHNPDGTGQVDNHDFLTGSNEQGKLHKTDWGCTCHDWTSSVGSDGRPRVGHSWPRSGNPMVVAWDAGPIGMSGGDVGNMDHWISALDEAGCAAGVNLLETGGPVSSNPSVGSGGGYGGFYCFALNP